MSTNSECLFIEMRKGRWYYVLEVKPDLDDEEDSCGDWLDNAECYGPFASFEAAHENLHHNHANPGGFGTMALSENDSEQDLSPALKKLIDTADPPRYRGYRR